MAFFSPQFLAKRPGGAAVLTFADYLLTGETDGFAIDATDAAQTYGGCVLPDYKNVYIIGTSQVRYGFGPLVTPGVDLIARMMLAQDKMELPIGLVLKESGVRPSQTHLVDPHAALRGIKRGKRMLPLLVWKEKKLRKKFAGSATVPTMRRATTAIDREIPVW